MTIIDNIFLHFYNTHFFQEKSLRMLPALVREIENATLISLLFSDVTYIPIASFIESDLCNFILNKYITLFDYGVIEFIGQGSNLQEYMCNKEAQYPTETYLGKKYQHFRNTEIILPFTEKKTSATCSLVHDWLTVLFDFDKFIAIFDAHYSARELDRIAYNWENVPVRLGEKAFILQHIKKLLGNEIELNIQVINRLHRLLNTSYFRHFIQEFSCGIFTDLVYTEYDSLSMLSDKQLPYKYIMQTIITNKKFTHLLDNNFEKILINRNSDIIEEVYMLACRLKKNSIEGNNVMAKRICASMKEISIGIVTALPKEFAAMRLMIEREYTPDNISKSDPNDYRIGYIKSRIGVDIKVIIACLKEIGTNNASTVTVHMLRTFEKIDHVLLVGIAGGIPCVDNAENHVRIGDIVCSNSILQYDNIKQRANTINIRSNSSKPSSVIIGKYKILESETYMNKYPWEQYVSIISNKNEHFKSPGAENDILTIKGKIMLHPKDKLRRENFPRIFLGCIGSANILLKDEEKRDALRDSYNVRAIEMEGSGVADGTWSCEKSYFVIRGIVDYCNDEKNDLWHNYSALCAASYAKCLIELL